MKHLILIGILYLSMFLNVSCIFDSDKDKDNNANEPPKDDKVQPQRWEDTATCRDFSRDVAVFCEATVPILCILDAEGIATLHFTQPHPANHNGCTNTSMVTYGFKGYKEAGYKTLIFNESIYGSFIIEGTADYDYEVQNLVGIIKCYYKNNDGSKGDITIELFLQ